jgi:hypothetical protein
MALGRPAHVAQAAGALNLGMLQLVGADDSKTDGWRGLELAVAAAGEDVRWQSRPRSDHGHARDRTGGVVLVS